MATKKVWTDEKYSQLGVSLATLYGHSGNSPAAIAEHYMIIWDSFSSTNERPDSTKISAAIAAESRAISKFQVDGVLTMDEIEDLVMEKTDIVVDSVNDNVVHMDDFMNNWRQVYRVDDSLNGSTLTIHVNKYTKQFDVIQTNDDGESITTHMSALTGAAFLSAVRELQVLLVIR